MHDPFPLSPPAWLLPYVQPVADFLHMQTLPLHFHEIIIAFTFYHVINRYVAPAFSRCFFPNIYPSFNARTKLNWDVHIVSFVQSTLICALALWVMWADDQRRDMTVTERIHGYTGASGLIQAFAEGYFLWDLVVTVQNVHIFGIGMLFHAICALGAFSLGFRPFVNHYTCTFILYELSSPFLNIHWFCDKLNLTGSTLQLINGVILLFTFLSCRLVWGTYQSVKVFVDIYHAYTPGAVSLSDPQFSLANKTATVGDADVGNELLKFADGQTVPLWLAGAYLASNFILNGLNWFWFGKMIETIRSRFDPPIGTRKVKPAGEKLRAIPDSEKVLVEGIHVSTPAALGDDAKDYVDVASGGLTVEKSRGGTHLEVEQNGIRSRTSTKRSG